MMHHPSCPARSDAGAACICPRRNTAAEAVCFAAMLAAMVGPALYFLCKWAA